MEQRELNGKVFNVEPIYECSNCGLDIIGQPYENQTIHTEKDEHFCNEECEFEFVNKNL